MKRANLTGSIDKMSGKRRKPWRVRISCGYEYDEKTNKVISNRQTLGTFATKSEAEYELSVYLDNPYDIKTRNITFKNLYKLWKEESELSKDSEKYYRIAFNKLGSLYDMRFRDIKLPLMQKMIREHCSSKSQGEQMKSLFSVLTNFAIYYDVVQINNCQILKVEKSTSTTDRTSYTTEEIIKLFEHDTDPVVMSVLILIFTGMRIDCEFLTLHSSCIDYDKRIITIKKSKTENGVRYIPISRHIIKYLHALFDGQEYAFRPPAGETFSDRPYTYNKYREKKFIPTIREQLGINHIIHETRHTFATYAERCGMNDLVKKRIIGHSVKDLTQRVYTHTEYRDLIEAVNLFDDYMAVECDLPATNGDNLSDFDAKLA